MYRMRKKAIPNKLKMPRGYGDRALPSGKAVKGTSAAASEHEGELSTEAEYVAEPASGSVESTQPSGTMTMQRGFSSTLSKIFSSNRNLLKGGIASWRVLPTDLMEGVDLAGEKPYTAIAVGTSIGSLAAGLAAGFAPVPTPVKVLLGAVSIMSGGAAVYSGAKAYRQHKVEIMTDQLDKNIVDSVKWLSRTRNYGASIRNALAGITPDDRISAAQVKGFINYNKSSTRVKFLNYVDPSKHADDVETHDDYGASFNYPDWVDKEKVIVGRTQATDTFQGITESLHGLMLLLNNIRYCSSFNAYPVGQPPLYDPYTSSVIKDGRPSIGISGSDAYCQYQGVKFMACSSPPIKGDRPIYYHMFFNEKEDDNKIHERWVNANNFNDSLGEINSVPENAIIVGSKFIPFDYIYHDWSMMIMKQVWSKYGWITYNDYDSLIKECIASLQEGVVPARRYDYDYRSDKYPYGHIREHFNGFGSDYRDGPTPPFGLIDEVLILSCRPDLGFSQVPVFPGKVASWMQNVFDIIPILNSNKQSGDFLSSRFFQPFGINHRWFAMEKSEFIRMRSILTYEGIPIQRESTLSAAMKLASKILSIAATVISTLASFGATLPATFATTISLILTGVTTAVNFIAKIAEEGIEGLLEAVPTAIASQWGNIENGLGTLSDSMRRYFSTSADGVIKFYESVKGYYGEAMLYKDELTMMLQDVGNDLGANLDVVNSVLGPYGLPSIDSSEVSKVNDYIKGFTNNTERLMLDKKSEAERSVKDKIIETDQKLGAVAMDMVNIFY